MSASTNLHLKPSIKMSSKKAIDVEDRLSALPDPILVHILTFLPTPDAVSTMLLKSFGNLWTLVPNLDFGDDALPVYHCPNELSTLNTAFFSYVRNVLNRHRSPKITRFRFETIHMFYRDIKDGGLTHEVDSFMDFALRKNVENLEFLFGMVEPCVLVYKLPYTEFVSDSVTEMKLQNLEMKLQTRVEMGLLRVLRLAWVDISDDVFQEIVRGCPVLKELDIDTCFSLTEVRFDVPNIEKLILNDAGQIINCPNLRSFQYTGRVNWTEVKDLSSLVDATFNLSCYSLADFKLFQEFMAALKPVMGAKAVSLSWEFVTAFFYCMVKHLPQLSLNWKRARLSIWLTEKHIPGLCRLLRNSPYLEELVMDITSWETDCLQPIESELDNCSMDERICCSDTLKRVVINNVSMCPYPLLVQLVCIMLENASVLAELTISYNPDDKSLSKSVLSSEEWTQFSHKLPTFRKVSQHVRVLLKGDVRWGARGARAPRLKRMKNNFSYGNI